MRERKEEEENEEGEERKIKRNRTKVEPLAPRRADQDLIVVLTFPRNEISGIT